MKTGHFYSNIPSTINQELIEPLLKTDSFQIERIVSNGHASPPGFWYDQATHEWVMVLKGRARLIFEAPHETVELAPGDYVEIPSGCRHRVDWTDPAQETIWLAIHFE